MKCIQTIAKTGIGFAMVVVLSACAGSKQSATVITNVTAIDALGGERGPVDVVIVGDKIAAMGAGEAKKYEAIEAIDGTGRYVIPGLWDAHVHLAYDKDIGFETFFPLSLAHGVTSMRDTGGHLNLLAEARAAAKADPSLPNLYVSGPLLDGEQRVYDGNGIPDLSVGLATPAAARAKVDELATAGVSFVKAYEMLNPEVFAAIADQAQSHGLPVAAHIPLSMTGQAAIAAGANDMQHFRNLEMACAANGLALLADRQTQLANPENLKANKLRSAIHASQRAPAVRNQDSAVCDEFIDSLAKADVFQTPTLTVTRFMVRRFFADAEWKKTFPLMRPDVAKSWAERSAKLKDLQPKSDDLAYDAWVMSMVKRLAAAGVPVMAGTDAPIGYLTPGASLHEELFMLVEGGLTTAQALRAATYEPARFLGVEKQVGSLDAGMTADLVLLSANPLADIRNIAKIDMVFKNGLSMDRTRLDELMGVPSAIAD